MSAAQDLVKWLEELRLLCQSFVFATEDEPHAVAVAMVTRLADLAGKQAVFILQQFPALTEEGLFANLSRCLEELLLQGAEVVDSRGSRPGTWNRIAGEGAWSADVDGPLYDCYLRLVAAIEELRRASGAA